ncbi:hypothetical protein E7T06_13130 [Deinococcus sp. Arct2-2]|uniref:hypothetical protein n=1 Tax=Deinococcus sp. Arct2-2 TaxID=2568653 RepID=UPI0010A437F2|nr:hypothetical protein [Deinococcus sp. Arct2-2]THF69212.1 hypothetical protein E7T06_13130 [Deinococcus sp. Arct2-2]
MTKSALTEPEVQTVVQPPGPPPSSPASPHPPASPVVPWGTLMVIGVLLLSILWLWTLVLGIQQGRA